MNGRKARGNAAGTPPHRRSHRAAAAAMAGPATSHRERELKLAVPPDFQLVDLTSVAAGVEVSPVDERHLSTVYWDTPDLRLIRWGCSLRHRAGEGWTVKLPRVENSALLVRDEHSFPGPAGAPPEPALDLVRAYVRTSTVAPVVRMRTARRAVSLLDTEGRRLAEIDDDDVSVQQGRRVTNRFREIEVEITEHGSRGLLKAVVQRLHAGGAGAPDPTPKVVRALGTRALEPAEVERVSVARSGDAGGAVRAAIAASVARLMRHDPGVRLGGEPEDVHQARVATRRLRSDLRTFEPLLDEIWARSLRRRGCGSRDRCASHAVRRGRDRAADRPRRAPGCRHRRRLAPGARSRLSRSFRCRPALGAGADFRPGGSCGVAESVGGGRGSPAESLVLTRGAEAGEQQWAASPSAPQVDHRDERDHGWRRSFQFRPVLTGDPHDV